MCNWVYISYLELFKITYTSTEIHLKLFICYENLLAAPDLISGYYSISSENKTSRKQKHQGATAKNVKWGF